jgi:hypothetical protein
MRTVKAIIVIAITVISVFIWVSFLLVGDLTDTRSATQHFDSEFCIALSVGKAGSASSFG